MNANLYQAAGCNVYTTMLDEAAQRWGIIERADVARWLAQLSVESVGFTKTVESMAYRAETLLRVCNGRNGVDTLDKAAAIVSRGSQAIAEALYGGSWGASHLGNTEPGDGARFIGRGLIQLTGRSNYRAATIAATLSVDYTENPELLTVAKYAADAAAWFWMARHLNGEEDIIVVTKRINGGSEALDKRMAMTNRLLALV